MVGRYVETIGLALPGLIANKLQSAANTACPAGSFTSVLQGTLVKVPDSGLYSSFFYGALWIQLGATAPTALAWQSKSTSGNTDAHSVPPSLLVNSALIVIPVFSLLTFNNPATQPNIMINPGQTFEIDVNPTAQAVTVLSGPGPVGSAVLSMTFRNID